MLNKFTKNPISNAFLCKDTGAEGKKLGSAVDQLDESTFGEHVSLH